MPLSFKEEKEELPSAALRLRKEPFQPEYPVKRLFV